MAGGRRLVPVLVAAGVVATVGVGAAVSGLGGGPAGAGAPGAASGADAAAGRLGAPEPDLPVSAGTGRYVLAVPLPGDLPDRLPVYRLTAAPLARVGAVAGALDLPAPTRTGQGWWASRSGGRSLAVDSRPGLQWSFQGDGCPAAPGVACAVASPVGCPPGARCPAPPPPPPAPAPEQVRRLAGQVVTAAGRDAGTLRLSVPAPDGTVDVRDAPVVGGLPVWGWDTVLTVDHDGVRRASGWLGAPARGAEYPLVPARRALAALAHQPVPMPACAIRPDDEGHPCRAGRVGPVRVVAVRPGLMLVELADGPALAPAWLFRVADGSELAALAVDPAYLRTAEPGPTGGGSGGSVGGGVGGSVGGAPGSVPPGSGRPSAVPPQPGSLRTVPAEEVPVTPRR